MSLLLLGDKDKFVRVNKRQITHRSFSENKVTKTRYNNI